MAGPSGPAFLYNFYPRSPCGERQNGFAGVLFLIDISIHALLAESDSPNPVCIMIAIIISIHALLAESDPPIMIRKPATRRFLSTLSLRRATGSLRQLQFALCHFYPRSPCGERLRQRLIKFGKLRFLSTLSLRRATRVLEITRNFSSDFYPRSPCGERLLSAGTENLS